MGTNTALQRRIKRILLRSVLLCSLSCQCAHHLLHHNNSCQNQQLLAMIQLSRLSQSFQAELGLS